MSRWCVSCAQQTPRDALGRCYRCLQVQVWWIAGTTFLVALVVALCSGCMIVSRPPLLVVAPMQARVTIGIPHPAPWTPTAAEPSQECSATDLPVEVDSTVSVSWGTTLATIATGFFAVVKLLGWP